MGYNLLINGVYWGENLVFILGGFVDRLETMAKQNLPHNPILMEVENGGLEDDFSPQGSHFPLPWLWEEG